MSESITSPPYPGLATNSNGLYHNLHELRAWLSEEQEQLKYKIKPKYAEKLAEPEALSTDDLWAMVGVCDKFFTLNRMRQLREIWDAILREHEDSWESKICQRRRFEAFMFAHFILKDAFMNPETREFRAQRDYNKAVREQQRVQKKLHELLKDDEHQQETYESDEEQHDKGQEDDWFSDDIT